ncbi:MAG TPA: hypothetical protein DCZ10_15385 [Pelotomaculum sp.]|nr:hypothetical protein [Pelotomaculum sp.]
MSKNTDRIAKALKAKGWEAEEIEWTPIERAMEMCGPGGGWSVMIRDENGQLGNSYHILEYNIRAVLEKIELMPINNALHT